MIETVYPLRGRGRGGFSVSIKCKTTLNLNVTMVSLRVKQVKSNAHQIVKTI